MRTEMTMNCLTNSKGFQLDSQRIQLYWRIYIINMNIFLKIGDSTTCVNTKKSVKIRMGVREKKVREIKVREIKVREIKDTQPDISLRGLKTDEAQCGMQEEIKYLEAVYNSESTI